MKLSIIIVAFRSQDKLRVTLTSVFSSVVNVTFEVFVVDNGSGDSTPDMVSKEFPQAVLIRNVNNGFSKGNNIAIKQSTGEYVLLLNPDTELAFDSLQLCIDRIEKDPKIGILGPKLIKGDGTLDLACRRTFPNPANAFYRFSGLSKLFPHSKIVGSYNLTYISDTEEQSIDSCSGAFLLIRRSVIEYIGLLDETFFMYGEDIDWCYRVKQAGFLVWYYPKAIVYHYKGSSSKKTPYIALYNFHAAMWIFYRKHYKQTYPFIVNWFVYIGIWLRFTVFFIRNFLRRNKFVSK